MLLGVLDIGSHTAQLQVFEVRPGAPPRSAHTVKEPTLLGEAFDAYGAIDGAGIDRAAIAVRRTMEAARQLGVRQPHLAGCCRSQKRSWRHRGLAGIHERPPGSGRASAMTARATSAPWSSEGSTHMGIILLVLLLALILGGLGFILHILWWIALVVIALWLLGFLVRVGEGTSRGRWYRW